MQGPHGAKADGPIVNVGMVYDQLFHEAMNVVGVGVGSNFAGKILGKVGARATTGYLNRVLLIRLGRYSIRLLQPVSKV